MEDFSKYIYVAIGVIFLIGRLITAGRKKTETAKPQQRRPQPFSGSPAPPRKERTIQDILEELTGTAQSKAAETKTPAYETTTNNEFSSLEEAVEEEIITDEMEDHHVHGKGFDDVEPEIEAAPAPAVITDWRQAIIASEVLKRPDY